MSPLGLGNLTDPVLTNCERAGAEVINSVATLALIIYTTTVTTRFGEHMSAFWSLRSPNKGADYRRYSDTMHLSGPWIHMTQTEKWSQRDVIQISGVSQLPGHSL